MRELILSDGRRLGFEIFGDPDGTPVLTLHGTPGSRLKFEVAAEAARNLRLAIISVDRWGYGGSDAPADPTLLRYADDVRELLDHLGVAACAVVGVSGGGPYAVAVAGRLGRRVSALALVAPVGQLSSSVQPAPEMSLFHRFCFRGLAASPVAVRGVFNVFRWTLMVSPDLAIHLCTARAGRVDKPFVRSMTVRRRLAEVFWVGLKDGAQGPVLDMDQFRQAWRVDLSEIVAPSRMWIGREDRNIPLSAARALAAAIRGCELIEIEGYGHYWISQHYREVLEWLASETKRGAGVLVE